jgi:hypothetical protein
MDKKTRLGPDPLEWIRDNRKDTEGAGSNMKGLLLTFDRMVVDC